MIYRNHDLLNVPVDGCSGSWRWSAVLINATVEISSCFIFITWTLSAVCIRFVSSPASHRTPRCPGFLGSLTLWILPSSGQPHSVSLSLYLSLCFNLSRFLYLSFALCLPPSHPPSLLFPFSLPSFYPNLFLPLCCPLQGEAGSQHPTPHPSPGVYFGGGNTQPSPPFSHPQPSPNLAVFSHHPQPW